MANVIVEYWNDYYRTGAPPTDPSPFCNTVISKLRATGRARVYEIGCGNGRDLAHFARNGCRASGTDVSASAVEICRRSGLSAHVSNPHDPASLDIPDDTDCVYTRFVLHAMPEDQEAALLDAVSEAVRPGTLMAIETRCAGDTLQYAGGCASTHESVAETAHSGAHYRRFSEPHVLHAKLAARGFMVDELLVGRFSKMGDDSPLLLRIMATKHRAETS